jgi:hypothetical protein
MSSEEPSHLGILTNYLVRPCPGLCDNPSKCMFYHSTNERRRCPFNGSELLYCENMCQTVIKDQVCSDVCQFAHNFQEIIYHPNKYKLSWCEQANCKGYSLCHQAHRPNEKLRNVAHLTVTSFHLPKPFSSHLNLSSFKVQQCMILEPHNPKLCIYYHSARDRRRIGEYSYELCAESEKDLCGHPESCLKSHNRVEQLYHPDKYKMKFCTYYPNKIHECEYSSYCSFAHSEADIKIELIHNYTKNDDFYMYSFKTVWCPFILQHDKAICVYAHNWQDFRRKPKEFAYNPVPCPSWKSSSFILSYEEGGCKQMWACSKCHGWKEFEFHPSTYKLKPCTQGKKCQKAQDCPFYHSSVDRRNSDVSPCKEGFSHPYNFTPHPSHLFLTPDAGKVVQTPFITQQQSIPNYISNGSNASKVRLINSTTDEFVLHRGTAARTVMPPKADFSLRTGKMLSFASEEFPGIVNTPIKSEGFMQATPQSKNVDSRVVQFLSRHKLKHLSSRLIGVKWEDLDGLHLDDDYEDDELQRAWKEEKEDQDHADELINNDIALFTGRQTGNTPDLKKFAIQEDAEEFIVKFPNSSQMPTNLKCPITKKLMRDPAVFSLDGRTYERSAIVKHILSHYAGIESQQLIRNLHSDKHIRAELLLRFS